MQFDDWKKKLNIPGDILSIFQILPFKVFQVLSPATNYFEDFFYVLNENYLLKLIVTNSHWQDRQSNVTVFCSIALFRTSSQAAFTKVVRGEDSDVRQVAK